MAYRCAMAGASVSMQGSQTRHDTSQTNSTLRHCTTMPLQMGMEEGPRSKAVCVSGLQYCQNGCEKISLILLLSDLVSLFVWHRLPVSSLQTFSVPEVPCHGSEGYPPLPILTGFVVVRVVMGQFLYNVSISVSSFFLSFFLSFLV